MTMYLPEELMRIRTSNSNSPPPPKMIELEMLHAVDDCVEYWQKGNTRVETVGDRTDVYLHNNRIVSICMETDTMLISDCGWQTSTTKSRINCLLRQYTPCCSRIYQEKHQWYLDYGDGDVVEMTKGANYLIHLVDCNCIYEDYDAYIDIREVE